MAQIAPDRHDHLLSVTEAATFLGVPVKTLYAWRHKGSGPRGLRVGRHVRFRRADIEAWLDGRYGAPGAPAA